MPETGYTVASNDQLFGGNLKKKCTCSDTAEAAGVEISVEGPRPQSPSEPLTTLGTDLLDLYGMSSASSNGPSTDTYELLTSFPVPPRLTIRRATTPDIWLDTEASEPSTSDYAEHDERQSSLTDIYFSPLHISGSRCELSSPLNSPLTTPTQRSFDASVRRMKSGSAEDERHTLALSAEELSRLVEGLVNSDMVQVRLSSKRSRRSRMEPLSESETHREVATNPRDLQRAYESTFRNRLSDIRAPKARFCGVRLVDSSIEGSPTCMISKDTDADTDFLRIGDLSCTDGFHKSSVECSLRISTGTKDQPCRVLLQVTNKVLQRTSGKLKYLLIASIDVTEGFTKAALFEFLKASTLPLFHQTDRISTATQYIANLRSDACTMQTLILLSELSRIRDQFVDFYVVRATESHENGVPSRLTVPLVSEGLYTSMCAEDGEDLRYLIVGMLGRYAADGQAFTSTIEWDGEERRVRCVPLIDVDDWSMTSWVCFARDGFDIGDW